MLCDVAQSGTMLNGSLKAYFGGVMIHERRKLDADLIMTVSEDVESDSLFLLEDAVLKLEEALNSIGPISVGPSTKVYIRVHIKGIGEKIPF